MTCSAPAFAAVTSAAMRGVGPGDARRLALRLPLGRVEAPEAIPLDLHLHVGEERELVPAHVDDGGRVGLGFVGACPGMREVGAVQQIEGLLQRRRTEVHHVVVGDREHVEARVEERVERDGRRAKVPRLLLRRAQRSDGALEVGYRDVGAPQDGRDRCEGARSSARLEALAEAPREHDVAHGDQSDGVFGIGRLGRRLGLGRGERGEERALGDLGRQRADREGRTRRRRGRGAAGEQENRERRGAHA